MSHVCHAAGCNVTVPPRLLMCRKHWYMVPTHLRNKVWDTYRPGQEIDKNPSEAYMAAHHAAVSAVATREKRHDDAALHRRLSEEHGGGDLF